ncbi:MAG: phosphatidate cytidylyltransferase [Gemmatimonadota bacterium]|nr:phosphatidate cytidylyltransferase [Gemmatimonadota bacterium]
MAAPELVRRVVAGLALALLAAAAGWYGDWALAALLAITAALAAWEFYRIARASGVSAFDAIGVPAAALLPLVVHAAYLGIYTVPLSAGAVLFLGIFGLAIWRRGPGGRPLASVAVTLTGIVYTGGMLSFAYALRYHPYAVGRSAGAAVLLLPLLLTWSADTGGYFVGRRFGRRKLMPAVSPGKTVEGAAGGLVIAMLFAWLYERHVLIPHAQLSFSPGAILLFGAVVSVAAVVGDLAESLIKREAGVKDASRIIPGHGGVLDRIDSLLFVLPMSYWLLTVLRLLPVQR